VKPGANNALPEELRVSTSVLASNVVGIRLLAECTRHRA
jgi:hypothetical protein